MGTLKHYYKPPVGTHLRSFFSYYGGKHKIAKYYPEPKYQTIVEPFAGSAGYSLRYPRCKVILNDLNPVVHAIWDYLIQVKESEILSLPIDIDDVSSLRIPTVAKLLIGFWLAPARAIPMTKRSGWSRSQLGRISTCWGANIRHRIASQLQYIRHWKTTNTDYRSLDYGESCWFIDPPYLNEAGSKYPYHRIDKQELHQYCVTRPGQVIVCEQAGAKWLPFSPFRTVRSQGNSYGGWHSRQEVVWIKE
jgi:hypothetical protein